MSEGKKIHRLEPKAAPETKKHTFDGLEPKGDNVPFQKFELTEENVEEEWDSKVDSAVGNDGKWLRMALGVFALFFFACAVWAVVQISSDPAVESEASVDVGPTLSIEEQFQLRKEVVAHYFNAETLEDKIKYVRSSERVIPLMQEHYSRLPLKKASSVKVKGENPKVFKGKTLWIMHVDVNYKRVSVIVETLDDGSAKVDWETEVAHQPSDFDNFKETRSEKKQVFRVFIRGAQLDGFHGFEFADYNKYRCFKITIPNCDEYLWAYTEVGSLLDRQWVNFVTSGNRMRFDNTRDKAVMVELNYTPGSQSKRCVELGQFKQAGWLH